LPNPSQPYDHLNKRIYEEFLSETASGNFVSLPIDNDFVHRIAIEIGLSADQLLQSVASTVAGDWKPFIEFQQPSIPQYLGLIAIQLYAAYMMDNQNENNDEEYSEKAYNPRLCQLLRIESHQLQQLLAKYQDRLWGSFSNWCSEVGFYFHLPEKREGPHRYTRYPLSQALLNSHDLKRLGFVFDYVGLQAGESLFFEDFMNLLHLSDKHPRVTPHYLRVKERAFAKNQLAAFYHQIFDYYNQWDGSLPDLEEADIETYAFRAHPGGNFYLSIERPWLAITVSDSYDNVIERQSLEDPLALDKLQQSYRILRKGMLFFVASPTYEDHWECQRYLERDNDCLIIAPKTVPLEKMLGTIPYIDIHSHHPYFYFIQIHLLEGMKLDLTFEDAFIRRSPVKLEGGLKLTRTHWLHGAGPLLCFRLSDNYYINGQKIEVLEGERRSYADYPPGNYIIKHKDYSPVHFTIQEATEREIPPTPGIGWKLARDGGYWDPTEKDYAIFGFCIAVLTQASLGQPIRDWIEANKSKNYQAHPIITIKAINRSLHGIKPRLHQCCWHCRSSNP